jgi:hypothetical protein
MITSWFCWAAACYTAFFAAPAHYGGVWRKASFQYLVPANNAAAFAVHKFFHPLYEIALQAMFIFQFQVVLSNPGKISIASIPFLALHRPQCVCICLGKDLSPPLIHPAKSWKVFSDGQ